jgi:hypothetical protein
MYNISLIGIVTMNLPLYNEYILRKFYKIIIIIVRDLVGVTVIAGKEHRTQPGEKHHQCLSEDGLLEQGAQARMADPSIRQRLYCH